MKYNFVTAPKNYKGTVKTELLPTDPELLPVWKTLTGKRMATEGQLDALQYIITDVGGSNESVNII